MTGDTALRRAGLDVLAVLLAVHVDLHVAPDALRLVPGDAVLVAVLPTHGLAFTGEVSLSEVDIHAVTIERSPCCNKPIDAKKGARDLARYFYAGAVVTAGGRDQASRASLLLSEYSHGPSRARRLR